MMECYNETIDKRFGLYYLMSQEEQHRVRANGNVLETLNTEQQGMIPLLCLLLNEQVAIAAYIDARCAEYDAVIAANEVPIQKLKEYRQSIIYEAVTGKIEI